MEISIQLLEALKTIQKAMDISTGLLKTPKYQHKPINISI